MELVVALNRVQIKTRERVEPTAASTILALSDQPHSRSQVVGYRFHRTVLPVVLDLAAGHGELVCSLRAIHGNERVEVIDEDDHVLAGDDWFPVAGESATAIRNWIRLNTPLTLAAYVALYRGLENPFEFVDQLADADVASLIGELEIDTTDLTATLYEYQQSGLAWLRAHSDAAIGGILADEMGLGKTLQALGLLVHEARGQRRPSLVVMPLTLLENWRRELLKFAPKLTFYRHIGPQRTRRPSAIRDVDLVLTTYETVVSDVGLLSMVDWNLLITDEAQAYTNPETQRGRALARIPRRVAFAITGTPLENRSLDLWAIAAIAEPGFLGTREHFQSVLEENPSLLRAAVRPLILRREVREVAKDLPNRIDIDTALEMFGPEGLAYGALIGDIDPDQAPALALITRLRQFTTHPHLVGLLTDLPAAECSAKLTRFLEIVEEIYASGDKAIVFSAYRAGNDLLAHQLRTRFSMPVSVLDGRVEHTARQSVIDGFGAQDGPAALVMNPTVGGVGLNITAASHVIHYSLEWNPAKEDQATARAWRRGQSRPVTVHRLFYVATIDEAIVERLAKKRDLFNEVVEPIGATDEGELNELLASALRRWRKT
jgi:SNF2 family DNA or RNA helicase